MMGRMARRSTKRKRAKKAPKKLNMKNAFKGIRRVGAPSGKAMKKVGDALSAGTRLGNAKKKKMVKSPRFI